LALVRRDPIRSEVIAARTLALVPAGILNRGPSLSIRTSRLYHAEPQALIPKTAR